MNRIGSRSAVTIGAVTGLLALWLVAGSELLVPAGQPAPRLEGRTLDGRPWSDSVTGEITVVEFFATWCPKCRHALADEHRLAASRQFRLIIVDVDEDPLLVQDFFTRHPPPPGAGLLIDQSGSARANWGVTGFPSVFLVDKAGIVRKRFAGWGDGMAKYVAEQIDWLQGADQRAAAAAAKQAAVAKQPATGRRGRGKAAAPRDRPMTTDDRARQLGVEVLR